MLPITWARMSSEASISLLTMRWATVSMFWPTWPPMLTMTMRLTAGSSRKAGLDRPPVLIQVEDLLVGVPGDQIVRAGVRDLGAAGRRVDVLLLGFPRRRNDRNAGIELQGQHLELEARRRELELHDHRLGRRAR